MKTSAKCIYLCGLLVRLYHIRLAILNQKLLSRNSTCTSYECFCLQYLYWVEYLFVEVVVAIILCSNMSFILEVNDNCKNHIASLLYWIIPNGNSSQFLQPKLDHLGIALLFSSAQNSWCPGLFVSFLVLCSIHHDLLVLPPLILIAILDRGSKSCPSKPLKASLFGLKLMWILSTFVKCEFNLLSDIQNTSPSQFSFWWYLNTQYFGRYHSYFQFLRLGQLTAQSLFFYTLLQGSKDQLVDYGIIVLGARIVFREHFDIKDLIIAAPVFYSRSQSCVSRLACPSTAAIVFGMTTTLLCSNSSYLSWVSLGTGNANFLYFQTYFTAVLVTQIILTLTKMIIFR